MTQYHPNQTVAPSRCKTSISVGAILVLFVAVAVLSSGSIAEACSTPVYRYAMYNWQPSPYYVFYLAEGEPAEADEAVNKWISDQWNAASAGANLTLRTVDTSQQDRVDALPPPVKEAWEAIEDKSQPVHLVFTSWGVPLFSGRLDEAALKALTDSPVRQQLGKLFNDNCATIMMFLPGKDAKQNRKARKVAKELIEIAATMESETDLYYPSEDEEEEGEEGEGTEEESAAGLKIKLLEIDAEDEAEKWFVESLMAVEPDLKELTDEPMIFFAYGRGRAMPPYVGKGITVDNLVMELAFLSGDCSCQVKEQNPGVDLLMAWNWEETADLMAATDPELQADEPYGYGYGYGYGEETMDEQETPEEETADEEETATTDE